MGLLLAALLALAPPESEPKGRLAQASLDRCEEKIAEDAREGSGYMCLYDVTRVTSDYSTVETRLRRALDEDPENPWPYLALGALLHDVGKADAADMYRKGLARFTDDDTPLDYAMGHLNFAAVLRHGGDDDGAREHLDLARQYATKAEHPGLLRATTVELARHLAFTGRNLAEVQQLLDGLGAIPPHEYQTRVNVALTRAERYRRLGALEDALAQHELMAKLAEEQGDDYVLARALISAAGVHVHLAARRLEPDREGQIERLQRAHEAATRANHTYAQAQSLCRLAEFGGDAALERARACVEGFSESEDALGMVTSSTTLAAVYRRRGDAARYRDALEVLEARAAGLEDPQIRAMLLEETIRGAWTFDPENALAPSLAALDELDALWQHDERENTAVRRDVWRKHHAVVIGQLLERGEDSALALSIAERQRNDDILHTGVPRAVAPADITALQERLSPGHVVLAYWTGNDTDFRSGDDHGGAWVWAVTSDRVAVRRLPERRALAPRIRAFAAAIREDLDWSASAEGLRERLVPEDLIGTPTRVTVVPDRELFELSFATLLPGIPLEHVTSLSAIAQTDSSDAAPLRLEAFGDPLLPSQGLPRDDLRPLPWARAEAAAVVRTLGAPAAGSVGDGATETAFRKALTSPTMVHLAAHAVVNSAEPDRTSVVLAPSEEDDGVLTLAELSTLDVQSTVVVLSACESVAGPLSPGQGMHGLGQTFLSAGSDAVIGTLWPIRDDEAQTVFAHFYSRLAEGASLADALAAAQARAARDGVPARAWASIVLLGDGTVRVRPGAAPQAEDSTPGEHWRTVVGILLALAALGGLGVALRRPRKPTPS